MRPQAQIKLDFESFIINCDDVIVAILTLIVAIIVLDFSLQNFSTVFEIRD